MKLAFLDLIQSQFTLGLTIPNLNGMMLQQIPNTPNAILANMPQQVHDFLAFVSVEQLETSYDNNAVVYSGFCTYGGSGSAGSAPGFKSSNGSLLQLQDLGFKFRITIPRKSSASLQAAMGATGIGAGNVDFNDLTTTLGIFDSPGGAPSEYPNIDFRIEFLFNTITLHLPNDTFIPARLNENGWLEKDNNFAEVKINLPKIALVISQTADNYNQTQVQFKGWGINGLDEASDPAAGEMISMSPSLCLHSSGVVGFGLEKIVLDLSKDFTPPEILEKNFGIGDDFTGLWIPSVRLFIAPSGLNGFAVDTWAEDMLIDFEQGLSGEFGIELLNGASNAKLEVQSLCYQGKQLKQPVPLIGNVVVQDPASKLITTSRYTQIVIEKNSSLQLRIRGGKPIYTINVKKLEGVHDISNFSNNNAVTAIVAKPVNGNTNINEWIIDGVTKGAWTIYITVTDQLGNKYEELMQVTILEVNTSTFSVSTVKPPVLSNIDPVARKSAVMLAGSQPDNDAVFIVTNPTFTTVTAANSTIARNANGTYRIPCARGSHVDFTVAWTNNAIPPNQNNKFTPTDPIRDKVMVHGSNLEYVYFGYDSPGPGSGVPNPHHYLPDSEKYFETAAAHYLDNAANLNAGEPSTRDRLTTLVNNRGTHKIIVYGYASFESHDDTYHLVYNDELSHRRASTLVKMLLAVDPTLKASDIIYSHTIDAIGDYQNTDEHAKGDMVAKTDPGTDARDRYYHVAIACYDTVGSGPNDNVIVKARVTRDPDEIAVFQTPVETTPAPIPTEKPALFRRMAVKVRFQRNKLVLAEVYGQLDFAKEAEQRAMYVQTADNSNAGNSGLTQAISTRPGATSEPSEPKGVVDFRLAMVYNEATRKLTQTLALGFDQGNTRNGLLTLNKFKPAPLANTMASLLLFAPLLNNSIESVQSAQPGTDKNVAIALMAAEVGLATALGLYAIEMDKVILFGAELTFSETSPDIWLGNAKGLDEIGIVFDYGVQFNVNFDLGFIKVTTKDSNGTTALQPPFVRYKALGFKMNFENGQHKFIPIFDTSKGYELSLGDPGALQITTIGGTDISDLLKILTARMAKENPFILEMDLAFAVNLGIITVDKIRVTVKINNAPDAEKVNIMVVPTQVSVNIPAALTGKGYLDMGHDKNVEGSDEKVHTGFRGYVDLTLIPLKLRIAASLGIGPVTDGKRHATAFFLGLSVELPVAIPLGGTGMGIYGFLGLFGMHYKRMENPETPDGLPVALDWFDNVVHGDVINIEGWGPQLDKWSFGLGIILGTMEGGFVMNMKGMFMLELPGPRILIFVKTIILFPKPDDLKGSSVGILAVVDLDFNIGRLTIGMIMQYEIESILSLRIPIEAEFNFDNASDWHVYIGSKKLPAEAMILGIVKGYAYLMFGGDGIDDFPIDGQKLLNGLSLAVGIGASIIFGDYDDGLYLEVAGDLKAGIGFSPLVIYGNLVLRGELHLWVVSISAWAELTVIAKTTINKVTHKSEFNTWIHGEACGKVSLLLFDVEGCVTIDIGSQDISEAPPLKLIKSLTLVSRSTALIQGQGVDRPIDGALAKAYMYEDGQIMTDVMLPEPVSIDAIIALDMVAAPDVIATTSFTDTIPMAPNPVNDFWVEGADHESEVRYTVISIKLNDTLLENNLPKPANWWQQENLKNSKESGISLALLSWTPYATPHAVQQSEQLTESISHKWGTTCDLPAPPTSVFWTFNQKPLGYNTKGWMLHGSMWPDAPNTYRSSYPSKDILIYEPPGLSMPLENKYRLPAKSTVLEHAKVITTDKTLNFNDTKKYAGRVLQFPVEHAYQRSRVASPEVIPTDLLAYFKVEETERIYIESKPLAGGNILLAVEDSTVGLANIIFRSLDKNNKVLEQFKATDFNCVKINTESDFPSHWKDHTGPWFSDVQLVELFTLINVDAAKYSIYLINFQPTLKPERFSITAHPLLNKPGRKAVLLCALELVEVSEIERFEFDKKVQTIKQETLAKAMEGDKKRALLKPDTTYKLEVEYMYQVKRNGKPGLPGVVTQKFAFKTDAEAPLRIDPWVLTTTPMHNMATHFVNDKVQIVFNDDSVIQLYRAYGQTLNVRLYKANGAHPEQTPEQMLLTDDLSLNKAMSAGATDIKTAFHHTLDTVIKTLGCFDEVGDYKDMLMYTLPIDLMRNTTYTMDIESNKKLVSIDKEPVTPLYRVSFTTSRYLSMKEMAGIIRSTYITTRALKAPLGMLQEIDSDNQMQTYLLNAGLDALEPADDPRIMLLWANDANNKPYPQALLIDTPEPIWRKRSYPQTEIVKDEEGKDMKHWVMKDMPELAMAPNALVDRMSHNQTGTRTIIYLKTGAAGQKLKLQLLQNDFVAKPSEYGIYPNVQSAEFLNIILPNLPPWMENE